MLFVENCFRGNFPAFRPTKARPLILLAAKSLRRQRQWAGMEWLTSPHGDRGGCNEIRQITRA